MSQAILFDTFNAKYLSYKEIAETFIFNHQFEELVKNNNSLLMGPRGSGKTTMLKMLTPFGMHYWVGKEADYFRETIPFTAIYIPTDIQWKRQIEQLASDLADFPRYGDVVSRALVTSNILLAITSTFRSLIELHSDQHPSVFNHEANIARELISLWRIENASSPTFMALETALMNRIGAIRNHIKKTIYTCRSEADINYPDYFFDDYLELVRISCKTFENEFKPTDHPLNQIARWALCFDELEIAPRWLQLDLLNHLRGRDQNILFKLTTSPIVSLYDETSKEYSKVEAQEDNDFKVIRIWLYNQLEKQNWIKFSERLISEKLQRKFGPEISAGELFGKSNVERVVVQELGLSQKNTPRSSGETYGRYTPFWVLFKELALINPSFKSFLLSKKIDPSDPVPKDNSQKDSVYRKIKQLASYRYILLKENQKRSRKIVPLFYGIPFIYEVADGNPRQLIGLLDELLANATKDESGRIKPLPINLQARIIANISHRFVEQVENHPEANKIMGTKHMHLGEIVKTIGNFFYKEMITGDFKMDPRNTFKIDSQINQKFVDLVQLALHLGVIIYVNPKEAISQKGLFDKEFRLNYLLSPYFKILAREYDSPVRLSHIFRGEVGSDQQKIIFG